MVDVESQVLPDENQDQAANNQANTGLAGDTGGAGTDGADPPPGVDYSPLDFNPNEPSVSAPLVYPSENFNYPIPNDLFELHRAGYHVPLSLLTVAIIVHNARGERPAFHLPLDPNAVRTLDEWVHTDKLLPFQEWIQASGAYLVLLEKATPSGHREASVYAHHVLRITSTVHGGNWDIFREYDFRVRSQQAVARRTRSRIGFDIRQLNQQQLGLAAGAVRSDGGTVAIVDITGALATPWDRLLSCPYPDRARTAHAWNSPASAPVVPPVQAGSTSTSSQSPKRKTARVAATIGYAPASSTPFAPASSSSTNPPSW
ncbi:hypothetical protein CF319_g8403 [Tilletia indica]|nr:hypothetical protein CF319_g8403 [Tilletia indica]